MVLVGNMKIMITMAIYINGDNNDDSNTDDSNNNDSNNDGVHIDNDNNIVMVKA